MFECGLEKVRLFAEAALALAERVGRLLQLEGLGFEARATAFELAQLSAERSEKNDEAKDCAERSDRDENRLLPPIR